MKGKYRVGVGLQQRVCFQKTFILNLKYTAFPRKVVGKSARDNCERYCGGIGVHCCSKKFERMAREAMGICLLVLKESNKSRFDSYSVRNSILIISHVTFQDCRVHIISDNVSRNSCKPKLKFLKGWGGQVR